MYCIYIIIIQNVQFSTNLSKSHIYALVYCIGREGNGTPLQYSCLENPMDRGAW